MPPTASSRVVPTFLITALAVPTLLTAIAVILQSLWWSQLPDPVAIHWGPSGLPDGFGSAWTYPAMTVGIGLGVPTVVALTTLPMLRRGARGWTFRFMGAFALGMSAVMTTLATLSVAAQRGLASAADAPQVGTTVLAAFAMGLILGGVGWLVQPRQTAQVVPWQSAAEFDLGPAERAVWMRTTSMARWTVALVGLAGVGLVGGAIAAWVKGDLAMAWLLVAAAAVIALAVAAAGVFHVRVDNDGLTAVAALGFPRVTVPLADVTEAGVAPVHGFAEFGGYGFRLTPGATGIIMRNGEALQVTRNHGKRVVVTVDDAASAAALLTALVARQTTEKGS